MPSTTAITVPQLYRPAALPNGPTIVDVRIDEDYDAVPRLLPPSVQRDSKQFPPGRGFTNKKGGRHLPKGTEARRASRLRHEGIAARASRVKGASGQGRQDARAR